MLFVDIASIVLLSLSAEIFNCWRLCCNFICRHYCQIVCYRCWNVIVDGIAVILCVVITARLFAIVVDIFNCWWHCCNFICCHYCQIVCYRCWNIASSQCCYLACLHGWYSVICHCFNIFLPLLFVLYCTVDTLELFTCMHEYKITSTVIATKKTIFDR